MTHSKKQLLQDAYFFLGKTMPASEITIQKLIDEANISRSTFYYYFEHMLEFTIYLENELLKPMQNFLFTQDAEKNRAQIITALTYFQEKRMQSICCVTPRKMNCLQRLIGCSIGI